MSEWGNPAERTSVIHTPIHNVWKGTRGTETSKYPEEKKEKNLSKERNIDFQSSGERNGKSLNRNACIPG